MDARREGKTPQSKGCPWIPTTPAKPDSTRHQPVCSIWQESPHVQSNWLEPGILTRVNQITQPKCSNPGRLPGEFLAEAPNQTAYGGFNAWRAGEASSSGSHVYRNPLQSLGTWQAGEHNNSHVYRADFLMDNKLTVDEGEAWNDMPFGSLLALAGNPPAVAAVQNAVRQADFAATSTTVAPRFQPHQMLSFGNSSVHELDSLLGDNSTHHILRADGSSMPSRPFFDLKSPPKPIAHAAFSKSILFQFEPITPEKTNKADNTQETNTHNPSTNCEPLARDAQANTANGEAKECQKMIKEPNNDQLCANTLTQEQENNEPDKRGADEADLIKTPQQKPRRRKHRPKVVIEVQTKTTSKPRGRPPSVSEDTRLKRTYVQRKRVNNPINSPSEWVYNGTVDKGLADPSTTRSTRNSCRKSLNFSEGLEGDQTCIKGKCQIVFSYVTSEKEANTVQVVSNPDIQWTPPDDSICSSIDLTQERQARGLKRQHTSTSASTSGMHFPTIYKKKRTEKKFIALSSSWQSTMTASERNTPSDSFEHQLSQKTNQGSSFASKASNLLMINTAAHGTKMGQQNFEDLLAFGSRQTTLRKRSKGHTEQQISEDLLALGSRETITRKRSKGHTRGRDLASLVEMCENLPFSPSGAAKTSRTEQRNKIPHELDSCVQALVADKCPTPRTKKRSKRALFVNPTVQYFFNHQGFASTSAGPPLSLKWKSTSQIDYIIDQLSQLDLNAENSNVSIQTQKGLMPYQKHHLEQCALVTYQRDGMLVPFDQFRRKKRRPQVDLDEETTRVWKLLLEDINSEGIDGTNDEKTKWWEEERKVFHGRADSFIARMHLIQGDRRFSPWKGSVVDSVVGVFLTQNVSDHLSSSAFMALAAHFPFISSINTAEFPEASLHAEAGEPEVCVLDTDETAELNESIILEPIHCSDSRMLHNFEDGKIIVNSLKSSGKSSDHNLTIDNLRDQMPDMPNSDPVMSRESSLNNSASLTENGLEMDDALSPHTSVIFSQNFPDSLSAQTNEIIESCSLSNSEEQPAAEVKPNSFTSSTSFAKLLQRAGTVLHGVYGKGRDSKESDENHQVQPESLALKSQNEDHFINPVPGDMSCSESSLCMGSSSGANAGCLDSSNKYCKFSDTSSGGLRTAEISGVSAECVSQTSNSHNKIETNKNIVEKQTDLLEAHNLLQESSHKKQYVTDVAIRRNIGKSRTYERKFVNDPDYSNTSKSKGGRTKKEKNRSNTSKSKGGRTKKEKNQPVDWDQLRRHAEDGGRKREKTANTMDSVDWDAVRCTDVEEIAQSIKERGMNNMLAERIKAFLNRLVRDHGSIDLEWLRDIPPDKAKEYLLSFTGLGLKSVECVRLLTLHHLAFPVDTNVGRIAVRLGWVPLQPLPESLQLHLLELYPVLETIQKYLWPRLCKLDQRTLYELHYQLITFGKVFCTKRKPNCNACPMRGECRHFASEFASARLALPAPDEKRIVPATENKATGGVPTRGMNILQLSSPLPLPEEKSIVSAGEINAASHYSTRGFNSSQVPSFQANAMKMKSGVSNSQPIIEEPATPEPIIEKPTTPIPEYDIEDIFCEDPDEIPTIQFDMEQFTQNLQNVMQNTEAHESDMSKALVALTPEAASLPVPKLKNVSRLRTEHRVYELPDSHPLLNEVDKREPDDPSPYLLAIWTPGETVNSIEPPEIRCGSQESGKLCTDETCVSCNSTREQDSQTVRGTLLIPCRTAMKGSFPLNGTYFQVNEVFSDHKSSLTPIDVPRRWLWNLPRRTVFFGTSIPTIFKGLTTEGIQYCFWRGFVCVRGFDRESRVPRPLITRLHFPASKLTRGKGKIDDN